MSAADKKSRVLAELNAAGIVGVQAQRMEARNLYKLLHDNEHIMGAIRGRHDGDGAMFVATDKRMLLLNYKPLFSNNQEISYYVLAGVSYNPMSGFAGVTIHTKMGNFDFKYVNKANAKHLVEYLEQKHLDKSTFVGRPTEQTPKSDKSVMISKDAHVFLATHNLGVLSTINLQNEVNGAVIYYVILPDNNLYMVTKSATKKAKSLKENPNVAFTVYDEGLRTTAQIRGTAKVEASSDKANKMLKEIIRPHLYNKAVAWPPITQIAAGAYQVICVSPTYVKFSSFADK